jgi:predicted Rossmann fold flavoprotein
MSDRIIVIGGGAAGLMAAGQAAEAGGNVLLIEKTKLLGNKLRLTGKGHGNLTNACDVRTFLAHLGPRGPFLRNALARFSAQDTIAFFEARGVPTTTKPDGRVLPASNNAHNLVKCLRTYCLDHNVQFRYGAPATEIIVAENRVGGVVADGKTISAGAVIVATGGLSYPQTGSTGDGYRLARALGHTIAPLGPGLVPIVIEERFILQLQGLSLSNVRGTFYGGEQELDSERGEMIFTHFGVSGPLILSLSSRLSAHLKACPLRLSLDLVPNLDADALDQQLQDRLDSLGKASYHSIMQQWLPRSMIDVFATRASVPPQQRANQITAVQRKRTRDLLKSFDLTVTGTRPIEEAMVTLGGISCDEIVPQTMASRLMDGLYFAGEIIDVAGNTGGYNLQIAFTTGYVAGESATRALANS